MLVQPAGLTRFQQTDFVWSGRLGAEDKKDRVYSAERIMLLTERDPEAVVSWDLEVLYIGEYVGEETDSVCPWCGARMHMKPTSELRLRHLSIGSRRTPVAVKRKNFRCPRCGKTVHPSLPFQAEGHHITQPLWNYVHDLCARGFTHVDVQYLTGVDRRVIEEIDKARLMEMFTHDGRLRKPEKQGKILGIDEFRLHRGHKYATQIMDIGTGHVLYLAEGRTKKVVYDSSLLWRPDVFPGPNTSLEPVLLRWRSATVRRRKEGKRMPAPRSSAAPK